MKKILVLSVVVFTLFSNTGLLLAAGKSSPIYTLTCTVPPTVQVSAASTGQNQAAEKPGFNVQGKGDAISVNTNFDGSFTVSESMEKGAGNTRKIFSITVL